MISVEAEKEEDVFCKQFYSVEGGAGAVLAGGLGRGALGKHGECSMKNKKIIVPCQQITWSSESKE